MSTLPNGIPSADAQQQMADLRVWPVYLCYGATLVAMFGLGMFVIFMLALARMPPGASGAAFQNALQTVASMPGTLLTVSVITSLILLVFPVGFWLLERGRYASAGTARFRLGAAGLRWRHLAVLVIGCLALSEMLDCLIALAGFAGKGSIGILARATHGAAGLDLLALLLVIGALAPLAEEVFFRGYVQTRLSQRHGPWPAILIASGLFGLLHLDLIHTPFAFAFGAYLGWVTEHTSSIRPAIVLHVANNVSFVLLGSLRLADVSAAINIGLICFSIAVGLPVVWWLRRHFGPLRTQAVTAEHKWPSARQA